MIFSAGIRPLSPSPPPHPASKSICSRSTTFTGLSPASSLDSLSRSLESFRTHDALCGEKVRILLVKAPFSSPLWQSYWLGRELKPIQKYSAHLPHSRAENAQIPMKRGTVTNPLKAFLFFLVFLLDSASSDIHAKSES